MNASPFAIRFLRTISRNPPPTGPHKIPKPLEIKDFLDQYVIGQEATKRKLAVAVYNHSKRIHMNRMRNSEIELAKSQHSADRPHRYR